MIREIDETGALHLVAAIARQWLRELPDELPVVAAWLGLEPHQLRHRPARAEQPGDGVTTCRQCGLSLSAHPSGKRGRAKMYCGNRCKRRYNIDKTR